MKKHLFSTFWAPSVPTGIPKNPKILPNDAQRGLQTAKADPKGIQGGPKGPKVVPKGAQGIAQGAQRVPIDLPNGPQMCPKHPKGAPKEV